MRPTARTHILLIFQYRRTWEKTGGVDETGDFFRRYRTLPLDLSATAATLHPISSVESLDSSCTCVALSRIRSFVARPAIADVVLSTCFTRYVRTRKDVARPPHQSDDRTNELIYQSARKCGHAARLRIRIFGQYKLNEKFGWCADTHGICESATFDVVVAILLRNLLYWSLLSYIQTCSRHIEMLTR